MTIVSVYTPTPVPVPRFAPVAAAMFVRLRVRRSSRPPVREVRAVRRLLDCSAGLTSYAHERACSVDVADCRIPSSSSTRSTGVTCMAQCTADQIRFARTGLANTQFPVTIAAYTKPQASSRAVAPAAIRVLVMLMCRSARRETRGNGECH